MVLLTVCKRNCDWKILEQDHCSEYICKQVIALALLKLLFHLVIHTVYVLPWVLPTHIQLFIVK